MRWPACVLLASILMPAPARSDDIGPPTPEVEQAALRLADPALTVELVAAEPLVQSPVAIAWDERGALFVAEMIDYPVAPPAGKIKRLEDRDGDGRYEHATVFADGLPYPNGVLPWKGGVLVTAAPNIWFFKDNDGDGVADEKRVILTGFAEGNQQLRVNGLTWGLDNWVYGANGRSGGAIRRPDDPPEKAIPIPRNDFRFRPDTGEVEAIAGFSQFGLPRDDWGNRFPSWNTVPIRHVVLEDRELARNPHLADAATTANILDPADNGRVYSLAPPPVTFNGEPVAFFNASCGPTIYRGDLLPESYRGNAFVCEPLTSLVHRRVLVPDGPTFVAKRVEQGKEFLASTHPWFRPVNLTTGPDGALYVVDFCRAMVEHPAFVPQGKGEGVDFRRGHEFGRIWRIRAKDRTKPARPDAALASGDPTALATILGHENGWLRDTAQRLLVEAHPVRFVESLPSGQDKPLARVHALAVLDGLGALELRHLRAGLADADPRVREQALRLIESGERAGEVADALQALAEDPDPRVRFRAALVLGNLDALGAMRALLRIAERDAEDRWMRLAVLSGLEKTSPRFLEALREEAPKWLDDPKEGQEALLAQLGSILAAQDDRRARLDLVALLAEPGGEPGRIALLAGLTRPGPLGTAESVALAGLIDRSRAVAADPEQSPGRRARAVEAVARSGAAGAADVILTAIDPAYPREVQSIAARLVAERGDAAMAVRILERWTELTRATRGELLASLTRKPALAGSLLDAVEAGLVPLAELDPATRDALIRLPDAAIRQRVEELFKHASVLADRGEVLRTYQAALELPGSPTRGATVFEANCLTCHQRGDKGHRVGPDLSSVAGRAKETLLSDILDPNREVAPDHMNFMVVTKDGQVLGGLIAEETPAGVKLRRAEGVEEVVPRSEIAELRATGQSLMPVGLETALSVQDVADLIELLRQGVTRPSP
jgi:putative membrane-bound dehydrogenase-like protein